jgi:hypothetical protein
MLAIDRIPHSAVHLMNLPFAQRAGYAQSLEDGPASIEFEDRVWKRKRNNTCIPMKVRNGTIRKLNAIHFKMKKIARISDGQNNSNTKMVL